MRAQVSACEQRCVQTEACISLCEELLAGGRPPAFDPHICMYAGGMHAAQDTRVALQGMQGMGMQGMQGMQGGYQDPFLDLLGTVSVVN